MATRSRASGLAQGGIAVALAFVVSYFSIRLGFAGGSVSFQMVPLLVLARLRGAGLGVACGAVFGVLYIVQEPFLYHPLQALLDYPLAFGALGLAGLLPRGRLGDVFGTLLGCALRFGLHLLSGVLFVQLFTPQLPASPFLYSAAYNASYLVPSTMVSLVAVPLLVSRMEKSGLLDR